jgi:hypothetical protein
MSDPTQYRICVQGRIESSWSELFGSLTMSYQDVNGPNPLTVLSGQVLDQAELIGLLNRFYGLGLPLVSVQSLPPAVAPSMPGS